MELAFLYWVTDTIICQNIKPKTIKGYFIVIRIYIFNLGYNFKIFSHPCFYRIIIRAKCDFSNNIYKKHLPIIKLIFIKYL